MHPRPVVVPQRQEDVVVDRGVRPHPVHLRIHGLRRPEERDRLVDEVRAEVEQQAAADRGIRVLPPAARLNGRSVAVVARLDPDDAAQRAPSEHGAEGSEVVVVAAVLEDGDEHASGLRLAHQCRGVRDGRGDRLVDDDGNPGRHGATREGDVRDVRRGDDDEVDRLRRGEQLVRVAHDLHPRIRVASGRGAALRLP